MRSAGRRSRTRSRAHGRHYALFDKDIEEGALQTSGIVGAVIGAALLLLLYRGAGNSSRGRGRGRRRPSRI